MSASYQLLPTTDVIDYMDDYVTVTPSVAVKKLLAPIDSTNNTPTTLSVVASSDVDVAAASNVNLFFNNSLALYAPPSGSTVPGGSSINTLLLKVSQDAASTFARIDAGTNKPLMLMGSDGNASSQVC